MKCPFTRSVSVLPQLLTFLSDAYSGYMSPEYASEGIFSVKADVYSFGVLLLEIVSGKRNSSHHQYGDFINLLGYVSINSSTVHNCHSNIADKQSGRMRVA